MTAPRLVPKLAETARASAARLLLLLLCLGIAAGCGGQPDAPNSAQRVELCVAHNAGDPTLAEFARDVIASGCRDLKQKGSLPADGRVDVYAACSAPPEVPCVPAPGMTPDEVRRALAGAEASGLRPVSLAGRVEGYGLALTTGVHTKGDHPTPTRGAMAPPPDFGAHEYLSTFDSNEGFSTGGGFGLAPEMICDAGLAFGGPNGKKRAEKLQAQFAAALDVACGDGSIELDSAADVLRQHRVSIRAVLVGDVRPEGRPDTGPSIEIKVHASDRRARRLAAQWRWWNMTAPSDAPHYQRAGPSGRLFMHSIVDKRNRAAADEALDAALAAMNK